MLFFVYNTAQKTKKRKREKAENGNGTREENRSAEGDSAMNDRLVKLLRERRMELGLKQKEVAQALGVKDNTLSNWETGRSSPDLDTFVALCGIYRMDAADAVAEAYQLETDRPGTAELAHIQKLRALDDHGRRAVEGLLELEWARSEALRQPAAPVHPATRVIPLFTSPAAAGTASPVLGEDYTEYEIPYESKGDFAACISGDSMEPYIMDGSVVLVARTLDLKPGDVGLFCVDNDMYCKQYCEDSFGNIYLFSLNRARADADVKVLASSGRSVFCWGKVLLPKRPPLPPL